MKFPNSVGQIRTEHGLSREDLAEAVGATRQTIGLIETGKVCPSTVLALRIAKRLGVSVECLFADPDDTLPLLISEEHLSDLARRETQRVWVAERNGRRFARPSDSSMGWNRPAHAIWQRQDHGSGSIPNPNISVSRGKLNWLTHQSIVSNTVFVSGCDVGLGLLAECLGEKSASIQGVWFEVPNRRALWELQNGMTHVAAIHGVREPLGGSPTIHGVREPLGGSPTNHGVREPLVGSPRMHGGREPHEPLGDIPTHSAELAILGESESGLSPDEYLTIQFASAEMGWMVRRGNPEGFASAEDLSGGRLRFVNRPRGSGARGHVDSLLQKEGVDAASVTGYSIEVAGHRAVAEAVAHGFADVGFGHSVAAATLGLAFLPILEEVCTLVIPRSEAALPGVQALLNTLQSDKFRMELCALGPYHVRSTGRVE